jgi:methyl-accepting chemotaxis protein
VTKGTVSRRIAIGYAVLLLLLVIVATVGVVALLETRSSYRSALETARERSTAGLTALQAFDAASSSLARFLLTEDAAVLGDLEERFGTARRLTTVLRDESDEGRQVTGWSEAVRLLDTWDRTVQESIGAKRAGRDAEAERLFEDEVTPIRDQERDLIVSLVDSEAARSVQESNSASDTATGSIWLMVGISALAIVLGVLIAWGLARSITRRLRDALATLASSSAEILAATTQQASGVAEEEAAIQQTSTTADEVRQTAQVATEKAQAMASAVLQTAEISHEGRQAVDESIKGTQEARVRMETIAERILALSEQAQAISEIVVTVNGLAEQSNLLAVNAGIEAAKAGEAGKGFAVVATEVKALADQSKQATAQIREILGDIQRATQAAVMAAEQGVKASESGEAITSEAGEAIRQLAERLNQSAESAQQILVSSQQQMAGMEQVALAMGNIQETSAQNMASTRQVEQAARDINELSARLTELVVPSPNGAVLTKPLTNR